MYQSEYEEIGTDGLTRPSYVKKKRRGNAWVLYLLLAILLVVGPVVGVLWFLVGGIDPTDWVEESEPYVRSVEFAKESKKLMSVVGKDVTVEAMPETDVSYHLTEPDVANIVLLVKGNRSQAEVHVQWSRPEELWRIDDAWYVTESGTPQQIPFRSGGQMLDAEDMAVYDAADPATAFGRGVRAVLENRAVASLPEFRRAIEEDPENAQVYYWRGRAFEAIKNWGKAREDYEKALELDPEHPRAGKKLEEVKEMQAQEDG